MIVASSIAMQLAAKPLFSDVSVKFGGGNRYGLIGILGESQPVPEVHDTQRPFN